MIATSTIVMFGLMYLNTYLISHIFWSETRFYMALLMGATMAIIMLAYMLKMYPSRTVNVAIFAGAAVTFALTLWLVRSQVTVADTSYMRAMIPHHSIAVMTSSRANISDPRVRKLADEIIYAQDKEIAEMRYLIAELESGDDAAGQQDEPASVVSLDEALSYAHVAVLDPGFLTDEDIAKVLPDGPTCTFVYTQSSPPVLAIGADGAALVKLGGNLIRLDATDAAALSSGPTLTTDGMTIDLSAPGQEPALDAVAGRQDTNLVLSLDAGLRAGYRGFYDCTT
ncbi:DUF305 domain-containing protein [Loktanella sp. SALINAS62]|nr:DUF305 domain-containing protein [Loktanella sp. SALINAS62]